MAESKGKVIRRKVYHISVRRGEIPKPDGGVRLLGIPTVLDRMIQQAMSRELNKIYELTFSDGSYGFRSNRQAELAILKTKECINEGNHWGVDVDLEKLFDKVNHYIPLERLSRKAVDRRVLSLIRKYMQNDIMIESLKSK